MIEVVLQFIAVVQDIQTVFLVSTRVLKVSKTD
jgi:hypothetical protein